MYLRFREAERGGDFNATCAGQIAIVVEFLLQFGQLFGCEVCTSGLTARL